MLLETSKSNLLKFEEVSSRWIPAHKAWDRGRSTGSRPAKLLGNVEAPDEETAIKRAIEEFHVAPELQKRLLARRR